MKLRIVIDLDDIYADEDDSTGLTEPAHLDLTKVLARFGDIVDISKEDE